MQTQPKWALRNRKNVFSTIDQVHSGPGVIDQWLPGPHVQTSDPPRISQPGTLEHRYKKLHQSNKLDCFATHTKSSSSSQNITAIFF
jgi:hypothetical protein